MGGGVESHCLSALFIGRKCVHALEMPDLMPRTLQVEDVLEGPIDRAFVLEEEHGGRICGVDGEASKVSVTKTLHSKYAERGASKISLSKTLNPKLSGEAGEQGGHS